MKRFFKWFGIWSLLMVSFLTWRGCRCDEVCRWDGYDRMDTRDFPPSGVVTARTTSVVVRETLVTPVMSMTGTLRVEVVTPGRARQASRMRRLAAAQWEHWFDPYSD